MKKIPNNCEECLDRATLYWGFVVMDCRNCPRKSNSRLEQKELIMLWPKFGEPIQKTPEELGKEEGKKLAKKLIKLIWNKRS